MYTKKSCLFFAILIFCVNCSTNNIFTQGKVQPKNFYAKSTFFTGKAAIINPSELNWISKNFLFDTGAAVTNIQRDSTLGEVVTVLGASNRTVESGTETIKSFKIDDVEFVNTFATNGNAIGLKEQIPNFGGVIGRTIIDKANWLINYPDKTLEISMKDLSNSSYMDIPLDQSSTTPYTDVDINDKKYRAIIDLGSTSVFNVPQNTELAKELLDKYPFETNTRDRYTVGGNQEITELIGTIPLLMIGDIVFENIRVNINESSQIRLGIAFFKNYLIYIDNTNHRYRIKLAQ